LQDETLLTIAMSVVTDQFKVLKTGNVAGSVYRLLAEGPVSVYESPTRGAHVMRKLKPGTLVVAFSDPGELRQINTADQVFGYIKRTVKLLPVPGLDAEGLYDAERRAMVESTLPPLDRMESDYEASQRRTKRNQHYFMIGFVLVILLSLATVFLHAPAAPVK
jgi:hypothetical protein